jgi:hypothetical protein
MSSEKHEFWAELLDVPEKLDYLLEHGIISEEYHHTEIMNWYGYQTALTVYELMGRK